MVAALSNHLWQSTLFALAVAMLTIVLRHNQARVRYCLWLTASLNFLVPFALLVVVGRYLPWPVSRQAAPSAVSARLMEVSEPFTEATDIPSIPAPAGPRPTARSVPVPILGLWLSGGVVIVFARARTWLRLRATLARSEPYPLANTETPHGLDIRCAPQVVSISSEPIWHADDAILRHSVRVADQIHDRVIHDM